MSTIDICKVAYVIAISLLIFYMVIHCWLLVSIVVVLYFILLPHISKKTIKKVKRVLFFGHK